MENRKWKVVGLGVCLMTLHVSLFAAQTVSADYPVYVAQVPNLNDYSIFANAGWDGNWYVGYNNGWIKKLPPVPTGTYAHAFIGAKLGRMKMLPPVGKPPEFNPVPGEIWIALSSTPTWNSKQRVKLTSTDDIPLDGSPEFPLEQVGEAEWFWTEIPLASVSMTGDNYLALWSPSPKLVSVSSAPVLAAGWGGKDVNTWLAKDIKGEPPPSAAAALSTGIAYFQPALALKLIPAGNPHPLLVRVVSWQNGMPDHLKPVLTGSVAGESIERVWIEYDNHTRTGDAARGRWTQVGRSLWKAPYVFSLDQGKLPKGKLRLHMAAANIWGEKAVSDPIEIEVSPLNAQGH